MPASILAALTGALPLAQCFVRTAPAPRPDQPHAGRAPLGDTAPHRLRTVLHAAWRRHRSRQHLVGMNAYLLKDIGVSFAEAEAEANKPFWVA